MVSEDDHGGPICFNPVAEGRRRVIQKLRQHAGSADLVRPLDQFVVGNAGRQLTKLHGEIGELHLPRENLLEGTTPAAWAVYSELVSRNEQRDKKRKPLDMVPVRVR